MNKKLYFVYVQIYVKWFIAFFMFLDKYLAPLWYCGAWMAPHSSASGDCVWSGFWSHFLSPSLYSCRPSTNPLFVLWSEVKIIKMHFYKCNVRRVLLNNRCFQWINKSITSGIIILNKQHIKTQLDVDWKLTGRTCPCVKLLFQKSLFCLLALIFKGQWGRQYRI